MERKFFNIAVDGKTFFVDETQLLQGEISESNICDVVLQTSFYDLEELKLLGKISDVFYNEIKTSGSAAEVQSLIYSSWVSATYLLKGVITARPVGAPTCVNTYDAADPARCNGGSTAFPLDFVRFEAISDALSIRVHTNEADTFCAFIDELPGKTMTASGIEVGQFYLVFKDAETDRYTAYSATDLTTDVTVPDAVKIIRVRIDNSYRLEA